MHRLVKDQELMMFEHDGFWQPMDTSREYQLLNSLYERGEAPWSEINMHKVLHSFQGKRVLITGHTGFKGSWLTFLLKELGAEVAGYALPPDPGLAICIFRLGKQNKSHNWRYM